MPAWSVDVVRTRQRLWSCPGCLTYPGGGSDKDTSGKVVGARLADLESGQELRSKPSRLMPPESDRRIRISGKPGCWPEVLASKGIHIVVPRDRIQATSGIFTKTRKSELFIIPWHWIIGTTDTPYRGSRASCGNASGY